MFGSSLIFYLFTAQLYWFVKAAVIQTPKIDYGSNHIIGNRTVYGGVIINDKKSIAASMVQKSEQLLQISNHSESQVEEILSKRAKNVEELTSKASFELLKWPTINTRACPHYSHSGHNRLERGQGMSHMQIWMEFVFFDHDVLDARRRPKPEYITSNSYSSVSGIFTALQNGSLYKNGIPFLDNDVMLVFEDTAVLLSNGTTTSTGTEDQDTSWTGRLSRILSSTSTDIVSLGHAHCHHNHTEHALVSHHNHHNHHAAVASQVPKTGHPSRETALPLVSPYAYALTRAGARKLLKCYDLCGRLIEEQFRHCVESGMVSHSVAETPLFTCMY